MAIKIILYVCLIAAVSACTVNPVTGERQISIISAEQEVEMGRKNYGPYQQQQGGSYVVDPDLNLYVRQVGNKLAQVSDRPKLPYEFVVLNNDVPNAWALPGGKIAINRGLLVVLEDEAQLAAVLAHEIVHAAAKHGVSQMTQASLLGLGVGIIGVAANDSKYGQAAVLGGALGAGLWQAKYGRNQELESDAYGITYMVRAGYDPQAAVELQQTFLKLSSSAGANKSSWLEGLFASHPPSQERVDKNRQHAAKYPAGGVRNKAQYQRAIRQIKKDGPAYKKHQQSLQAINNKKPDQALSLVNDAIKIQNQEALFHITKGQILLNKKQNTSAKSSFGKAAQYNPEYYAGLLGLGLTQASANQYNSAETNLQKSFALLPTQLAAFQIAEINARQGDNTRARQYYEFAAQGGGDLGQRAQEKLQALTN